mgnify:CR=1 FL=1
MKIDWDKQGITYVRFEFEGKEYEMKLELSSLLDLDRCVYKFAEIELPNLNLFNLDTFAEKELGNYIKKEMLNCVSYKGVDRIIRFNLVEPVPVYPFEEGWS